MRIWFPVIRARSGSDVYIERLVKGLRSLGIDACLQWFDRRYEFLPDLLRSVKPPIGTSLIHANTWNGFAFARAGLPLVVTAFHCVYRCGYPVWKSRAQALYHDHWIGRYERQSFLRAAAVVVMTPSAAEDFSQRFTMPPCTMIHGWVNTETFKPAVDAPVADGTIRILIVGNNSKRKGMDLLPQLRYRLGPEFVITVVGGLRGSQGDACAGVSYKRRLSEAELVAEYQSSDLVVSLSRYEGFGYSALEGMACGKPVVAFNVTGIRDVVMHDISGRLVPDGDVASLARECRDIAYRRELAREMGRNGRAKSVKQFNEATAVASYLKLYASLV